MVPLCSKSFLIKFYQNWKIAIDVVFDLTCFSFELFKRTSCRKDEGTRGLLKNKTNNKTRFLVKLWPVHGRSLFLSDLWLFQKKLYKVEKCYIYEKVQNIVMSR